MHILNKIIKYKKTIFCMTPQLLAFWKRQKYGDNKKISGYQKLGEEEDECVEEF